MLKILFKFIRWGFTLTIGLYAIATLIISYYFYFFAPNEAVSAFIFSGYMLVLIPTFIIAVIIALLIWNLWLLLLLAPNLLIIGVFLFPYFAPKSEAFVPQGETIRVMTYNIQNKRNDETRNTFAELIGSVNPDIVAFQEFPDFNYFRWQESGQLDYEYIYIGEDGLAGQAVYSRYPILEQEVWVYEDLSPNHPHQRLLLDINGTQVVVYNIHPFPPIAWDRELTFNANEDELYAHSEAMTRLMDRIEAETLPLIVVGDMNMNDQFPEYQRMSGILTDSFLDAGYGFGFTYPAGRAVPQLIRLDYIFYSSAFRASNAIVLDDLDTSDHLPVVADLVLGN